MGRGNKTCQAEVGTGRFGTVRRGNKTGQAEGGTGPFGAVGGKNTRVMQREERDDLEPLEGGTNR